MQNTQDLNLLLFNFVSRDKRCTANRELASALDATRSTNFRIPNQGVHLYADLFIAVYRSDWIFLRDIFKDLQAIFDCILGPYNLHRWTGFATNAARFVANIAST